MSPDTAPPVTERIGIRRQNRMTRRSVLIADRFANVIISVGGLLVIFAVFAIMVFLAQVAVPLFRGAALKGTVEYNMGTAGTSTLMINVDENLTIAFALQSDGRLVRVHAPTGTALAEDRFDLGGELTSFARTLRRDQVLFGFADGSVRFGRFDIAAVIRDATVVPEGARRLDARDVTDGRQVFSRIPGDQVRVVTVDLVLDEPQRIANAPIIAADLRVGGTVERPVRSFVTIDAAGVVRLSRAEGRLNLMTRQMRTVVRNSELPPLPPGTIPKSVLLTEGADTVVVGTVDGVLYRYDTRDFDNPKLVERYQATRGGEQMTGMYFLIGEQSLVVTGSKGTVDIFFILERPNARGTDGSEFVLVSPLEPHEGPVGAVSASTRSKMFITADAGGHVWLRHRTSERVLLRLAKSDAVGGYAGLVLSPREDAIIALTDTGKATYWAVSAPHPETTLHTLFGRVWYEGYPEPTFTWQSSSGSDNFEPKLSLVPLIFGTWKATIYAMLFAVPLALGAAIYSSEFLHRRVRAVVKPALEMMEALPTVVLGFIAALILAPWVEDWVTAVLMVFFCIPVALLAAAFIWNLLPRWFMLRLEGIPKLLVMLVVLYLGVQLALLLADGVEALIFAGDIKAWLNGTTGGPLGFTTALLTPLALFVVIWLRSRFVDDWLDSALGETERVRAGGVALARWVVSLALAVLVAYVVALGLTELGYDPRGGIVDTYVQRNTLVVGFIMGFAVIPNIYTIAEDALNGVPEHLRGASLACGATPWQTAVRVILPTAFSGVFAAIMIGMGRAVGETMIVVMAAGNTPIMEWNIFNGLRTLSANIAVELPEAVKDGTLYRTLFLAALTLFGMTFVINTLAELVRQRFRRRAASL